VSIDKAVATKGTYFPTAKLTLKALKCNEDVTNSQQVSVLIPRQPREGYLMFSN